MDPTSPHPAGASGKGGRSSEPNSNCPPRSCSKSPRTGPTSRIDAALRARRRHRNLTGGEPKPSTETQRRRGSGEKQSFLIPPLPLRLCVSVVGFRVTKAEDLPPHPPTQPPNTPDRCRLDGPQGDATAICGKASSRVERRC